MQLLSLPLPLPLYPSRSLAFICHLNKLKLNENGKIVFFISLLKNKMQVYLLKGILKCDALEINWKTLKKNLKRVEKEWKVFFFFEKLQENSFRSSSWKEKLVKIE